MEMIKVVGNEVMKDFNIGKYLVTQQEYEAVMGYNPSCFIGNSDNPVESVNWYEAIMYCNKLSEQEGLPLYYNITDIIKEKNNITSATVTILGGAGYRLPTDEEWVYAAEGGNKSKGYIYSGSNDIDEVAWHKGNSKFITHPVGLKQPNELGIYDMTGNVWEWTGTEAEDSVYYVRGGSYEDLEYECEIDNCYTDDADYGNEYIGFRVCRS